MPTSWEVLGRDLTLVEKADDEGPGQAEQLGRFGRRERHLGWRLPQSRRGRSAGIHHRGARSTTALWPPRVPERTVAASVWSDSAQPRSTALPRSVAGLSVAAIPRRSREDPAGAACRSVSPGVASFGPRPLTSTFANRTAHDVMT